MSSSALPFPAIPGSNTAGQTNAPTESAVPSATGSGTSTGGLSSCVSACIEGSASSDCFHTERGDAFDLTCWCGIAADQNGAFVCVEDSCSGSDFQDFLALQQRACGDEGLITSTHVHAISSNGILTHSSIGSSLSTSVTTGATAAHSMPTATRPSVTFSAVEGVLSSSSAPSLHVSFPTLIPPSTPSTELSSSQISLDTPNSSTITGTFSSSAGLPATTTVVLTSPGSNTHSGPSRSLVGALAASLGVLLLVAALLLAWVLLRRRKRRQLSSSSPARADPPSTAHSPAHGEELEEKGEGEEVRALHTSLLEAATASPGDAHPMPADDERGTARSERQHADSLGAPSSTAQEAFEAFEAGARQEGLILGFGLFNTEFAEGEVPPPYEPRAQGP
ncbi:hypothetical protein PYCCODRAFT_1472149 [Trametes coccinea BRFM310]|uniref:CFEM domain-containing protein n=1 Tax=Trametes coccinea (strain BRFM310) TaxID=1353009 RepID=A0A1Y2I8J8_TRAC3|nr:hypothetical protein PYCCODRAFT_1472149 [Trametes coccinea BRFM310]